MENTKSTCIRLQNLERLLKLLIIDADRKKRGVIDEREVEIRTRHYHRLIGSLGFEAAIIDSIYNTMSELRASNMETDSHLVADLLISCALAYPDAKHLVIRGLNGSSAIIEYAGEGIAIALLEIANSDNCPTFEKQMFDAFSIGPIIRAMTESRPTSAGSGRLTTAIESFTGSLWIKSDQMYERRSRIRTLLGCWRDLLVADSMSSPIRRVSASTLGHYLWIGASQYKLSFLEKFADEVAQRYFMRATLGFRFYAIEALAKADNSIL